MIIVHPTSLSDTLDSAQEALFYQKNILPELRRDLAALLISRQIQSGQNAGSFIPFASEPKSPCRLFTGELLRTEFASRNLQLIEAARLLSLLPNDDPDTSRALRLSEHRMAAQCFSHFCVKGECRALSVAYMRFLAVIHTDDAASRLDQFLNTLAGYRDGKGKWHGFPFYYTLLMLSEAARPQAAAELEYSARLCERLSRQVWQNDHFSNRCRSILHKFSTRSEHDAYPLLLGQY